MKKILRFSAILTAHILILSLFASCSGGKTEYTDYTIYGMDTYITLRFAGKGQKEDYLDSVRDECARIIAKNEKLMSSHDEEAQIWGLNHDVDVILDAEPDLSAVLTSAVHLAEISDGAFSPTLGSLTELWNVSGGGPVPRSEEIEAASEHTDYRNISVDSGRISITDKECKIDLGGIAKGYTAQELLVYLNGTDISYGLVSMGGNIGVFGDKTGGNPFKVGICDPDNTSSVIGYLSIDDGFIAVSGDYERFFEEDGKKYHHIIDPETGYPAESGLRSVAVWSNNGGTADALSTALFVMGEERALEFYRESDVRFEAVMINDRHEIILTDGIKDGSFELSEDSYTLIGEAEGEDTVAG
ncbi:MAG: FAD:protein FMN transferase [Clostridiales bacterium]|nr:FAD:protein FMN transferase [Clostridiales bacterium]